MVFLTQINFENLSQFQTPLPKKGILQFFITNNGMPDIDDYLVKYIDQIVENEDELRIDFSDMPDYFPDSYEGKDTLPENFIFEHSMQFELDFKPAVLKNKNFPRELKEN